MLTKMIEEEILYRAAREAGLDRDAEIRRRLEDLERQTLVQAYLDRMHEEATRVDEDEARQFYEQHRDEYRTEKMVRVRMLLSERESTAQQVRKMVTEGNLKFDEACAKYSDNPSVVSARGLLPTWVRKDRAVPWIGNHRAFHEAAFSLEPGEISEPFRTPVGWHLIRLEEVREPRERSFEEVRDDVIGRISRERSTRGLPELLADLRERYGVKIHQEPDAKTADELFAEAQGAAAPRRRVELYEELVQRYPDHERVLDALFMIGFIRSEELGQPEQAREVFRRVIEKAPDSDLARSARWMLTSEEEPSFSDEASPQDTSQAPGGTAP
jgi:peptidyl-prolyl cis-trans isomerase C